MGSTFASLTNPASHTAVKHLLNSSRVRAISLDLDDTLWPIRPTMERAEHVLRAWLLHRAPRTDSVLTSIAVLRELHSATERERPDLVHDQIALRCESIRAILRRADEDTALVDAAFDAFFTERQRVTFYEDAVPALQWLSARYPLVAVSNGNADLARTGVAPWFRGGFKARDFGRGKPESPIFHAAAASVGLSPGQVLHVGDDAVTDVLGAIDAGMQAAWLVRDGRPWLHDLQPHLAVPDLRALCAVLEAA